MTLSNKVSLTVLEINYESNFISANLQLLWSTSHSNIISHFKWTIKSFEKSCGLSVSLLFFSFIHHLKKKIKKTFEDFSSMSNDPPHDKE